MITKSQPGDESRRERWERASNVPLTAAAIAFLIAYAWPILDPSAADGTSGRAFGLVTAAAWVAFVVDYVARLYLSRHRARFVVRNPFDLAARDRNREHVDMCARRRPFYRRSTTRSSAERPRWLTQSRYRQSGSLGQHGAQLPTRA